jgi:hypothetical protein
MIIVSISHSSELLKNSNQTSIDSKKNIHADVLKKNGDRIDHIDNDLQNENTVTKQTVQNVLEKKPKKNTTLSANKEKKILSKEKTFSKVTLRKLAGGEISACTNDQLDSINRDKESIGEGAQGSIFTTTDDNIVAKQISTTKSKKSGVEKEINISLLFKNSDNVINIFDACYLDDEEFHRRLYFIFMEKCEKDLLDWANDDGNVPTGDVSRVKYVINEISKGFLDVHNHNIVHLDGHPGNFMVCGGKIKLIDLGSAERLDALKPQDAERITKGYLKSEFGKLFDTCQTLITMKEIDDDSLKEAVNSISPKNPNQITDINDFMSELNNRRRLIML